MIVAYISRSWDDGAIRLVRKNVPASATGATGYSVVFGYDVNGLQTYARFGSASGPGITTTYDGFGRVASTTTTMDGTARTNSYQYDALGDRTRLSSTSGYVMNWTYDAAGAMTGMLDGNNEPLARFAYDAAGRRQGLALASGSTSTAAYGYDSVGRLQSLGHHLAGGGYDQTLTFGYNPASQIVTKTATNEAYASNTAYDVARTYVANGLNQYTQVGPAGAQQAFGYDLNGNLTATPDGAGGTFNYVYDAENRLVGATRTAGGVATAVATLSYDPAGRLWQVSGPSGVTRFNYDGDRLIEEFTGSGGWLRSYVHGPGPDEPLVWYEGTGGPLRRYLHADHQGSVIAAADDAGNKVGLAAYDEWGIPNSTMLTNVGRFGYTGQAWIPELGMYYYKARIYSPTLGRFLQTDPIGYRDQVNLYAYVGNDPVDNEDPTGTEAASVTIHSLASIDAAYREHPDPSRARAELIGTGVIVGVGACIAGGCEAALATAGGKALQWGARLLGLGERAGNAAAALERASIAAREFKDVTSAAGLNPARVGQIMGWGGGRTAAAQAIARTAQIDRAAVAGMRQAGLTRNVVMAARNFYRTAAETGLKGGNVAAERAKLMARILKNW